MRFLLIDTSTERGVIAYGNGQEVLFAKELPFGPSQSKFLMPDLFEALKSFGFPPRLDGIGVGIGPGSYTGIRLGVSVAQALAYSWKIPLIGISSLEGFIPTKLTHRYAAILDARIGGVYFQKGEVNQQGFLHKSSPQIASLEEIGKTLEGITHLVTPCAKSLQIKFAQSHGGIKWVWEERSPSVQSLLQGIEQAYIQGKIITPPHQLEILYLRQTEAEREKARKEKI